MFMRSWPPPLAPAFNDCSAGGLVELNGHKPLDHVRFTELLRELAVWDVSIHRPDRHLPDQPNRWIKFIQWIAEWLTDSWRKVNRN